MLEHGCDAGMSIVVVHDVSGCATTGADIRHAVPIIWNGFNW